MEFYQSLRHTSLYITQKLTLHQRLNSINYTSLRTCHSSLDQFTASNDDTYMDQLCNTVEQLITNGQQKCSALQYCISRIYKARQPDIIGESTIIKGNQINSAITKGFRNMIQNCSIEQAVSVLINVSLNCKQKDGV